MTDKETNMPDIKSALERIVSDAQYGIGSGDHELMNKTGYDRHMGQHYTDVETIRAAIIYDQERLKRIEAALEKSRDVLSMHDTPRTFNAVMEALADIREMME